MIPLLNKIFLPRTIIAVYVAVRISLLLYSLVGDFESHVIIVSRILSLLLVVVLYSFLNERRNFIRIILAVIILISGILTVVISLFIELSQPYLLLFYLVFGLYFTVGGILFLKR